MGVITTFYSYKGGVGRTMAVANIAVLLAKRGKKVLIVDWDLEAPGLHKYFSKYKGTKPKKQTGLMGLLKGAILKGNKPDWSNNISNVKLAKDSALDAIWSGCDSINNYVSDVLEFDWKKFYAENGGGQFIEDLRNEWKDRYDFIFIDSRAGIVDYGGICTIQLPDYLTLVFTPNEQSVKGVKNYAVKAQKARQQLAYDRMPLLIFPVLSRFDGKEEKARGELWLKTAETEMQEFYADWLPKDFSVLTILENTKLPYVPYYSFGEELAVEESSLTDSDTLGYAYNRVANLFENQFDDVLTILGFETRIQQLKKQAYEYFAKGEYEKSEKTIRKAIKDSPDSESELLLAKIGLNNLKQYGDKGQLDMAASCHNQIERLWQDGNDEELTYLLVNATFNLSNYYMNSGRYGEAEFLLSRTIDRLEYLGQMAGVESLYSNLGIVYRSIGELDKTVVMFNKALVIFEDVGNTGAMAMMYSNIGDIYRVRGHLGKAEEMFNRSLAIFKDMSFIDGMARMYGSLGNIYLIQGNLEKAEEMFEKTLVMFKDMDNMEGMATTYGNLGNVFQSQGDLNKAVNMYEKSLAICEDVGDMEGMANQYGSIGVINQKQGDLDKAVDMYNQSLTIFEKMHNKEGMATTYGNLGTVYLTQRKLDEAASLFSKSLEINEQLGWLEGMANQYANLGKVFIDLGNTDKAKEYWCKAKELYSQIGINRMLNKVQGWIDKIEK